MKLGLCLEMALTSLPFEGRVKTAARLGFKNVEIWWVDSVFKGTPDQLAKLAQANGVTITNTVINAPDGSVGSGLTDPRKSKDAWLERARIRQAAAHRAIRRVDDRIRDGDTVGLRQLGQLVRSAFENTVHPPDLDVLEPQAGRRLHTTFKRQAG